MGKPQTPELPEQLKDATTMEDLRSVLYESIELARKGKLSQTDGRNIIGLANQITGSISAEIRYKALLRSLGQVADSAIGKMIITR